MNNRGNVMLNLIFLIMGLAIVIIMSAPLKAFIDIGQGNNFLNCNGFVDNNANAIQNYSYNASKSSDTLSCLAIRLYMPYIFLIFLIAGTSKIIYDRGGDFFSGGSPTGG